MDVELSMMMMMQMDKHSDSSDDVFSDVFTHNTSPVASSPTFMNQLPISLTGSSSVQEPFQPGSITYPKWNSMAAMREMIFRIAAMQPVHIDPESVRPPKRRNVRISKDPQSVAARHRRERISERIRILQRLVPGGIKMDTASMLDEAIRYVKFLKNQVQSLEQITTNRSSAGYTGYPDPVAMSSCTSSNSAATATGAAKSFQLATHNQNILHYLNA